jgi:4'-phosphopantetheinyl transferase EntD
MERIQALDDGFAEIVCTRRERNWIRSLPSRRRPTAAVLLFSTKESFYKCQFPLTGAWLEFQDLEISLQMDHEQFEVDSAAAGEPAGTVRFTGRYLVRDGYVFTGVIARILESSCQS